MKKYVEFGPVMTSPPPIICSGANLYVFTVRSESGALDQLCKRVFEKPTGGIVKCTALGDEVILIFGTINKVSGPAGRPAVKEKNVLVHVPVAIECAAGIFSALFSPFVWVDNPNSMTGGREVFGYAKTWGAIRFEPGSEPASFALDTFGGNLDDEYWGMRPNLIQIKRKGRISASLTGIMDLLSELGEAAELLDRWTDDGVTEVFYKQFRTIEDPASSKPPQACLRQIATAEYVISPATDPVIEPLDHLYQIDIAALDSHPILTELGLPIRSESPCFRIKTSFFLERGQVLWQG
jgi:hypothetical protein